MTTKMTTDQTVNSRLPIGEVAFSGYRLLAARPMVGVVWFLFHLVVTAILSLATFVVVGHLMAALDTAAAMTMSDEANAAFTRQVWIARAVATVANLAVAAVTVAAATRLVLRPEETRFGGLRFGQDELRLMVIFAIFYGLFIVLMKFVSMAIDLGVHSASSGALLALQGGFAEPELTVRAALFAAPGAVLLFYLAIKLALAPAQTVAERKIRLAASWRLTKGNFWRLAAISFRGGLPGAALSLAAMLLVQKLAPPPRPFQGPEVLPLAEAFSPAALAGIVVQALLCVLFMAGVCVPAALAYERLTGSPHVSRKG